MKFSNNENSQTDRTPQQAQRYSATDDGAAVGEYWMHDSIMIVSIIILMLNDTMYSRWDETNAKGYAYIIWNIVMHESFKSMRLLLSQPLPWNNFDC